MTREEYALMLMSDKQLSDIDVVNISGLLNEVEIDDIPGVIHAVSILRKADCEFINAVEGAIADEGHPRQ